MSNEPKEDQMACNEGALLRAFPTGGLKSEFSDVGTSDKGVLAWSYLPGYERPPLVEVECHECPPVGRLEVPVGFSFVPYHDPKTKVQ